MKKSPFTNLGGNDAITDESSSHFLNSLNQEQRLSSHNHLSYLEKVKLSLHRREKISKPSLST